MKKYLPKQKKMCFCFPKQNKIFDFVSAIQNIFRFLFPQLNISLCLFPQVKIFLLAETKTKNMCKYLRKQKLKVFLLAQTKSKILFCLGKQKIFPLAWENNYRYILTCGNKAKDFFLLENQQNIFFCLQSCQHDVFGNRNPMSKNLYFGSKICNAL